MKPVAKQYYSMLNVSHMTLVGCNTQTAECYYMISSATLLCAYFCGVITPTIKGMGTNCSNIQSSLCDMVQIGLQESILY